MPHVQTPSSQVSEVPVHATQAAPFFPQAVTLIGWHTPAAQQPLGHEVASQTHAPPWHRWPEGQVALAPQPHEPSARQVLACEALQAVHAPPSMPHWVADGAVQVVPLQHPVRQLVALHSQVPLTHCWPGAHAALVPQRQAPPTQVDEVVGLQVVHARPPAPHAEADCPASRTHAPF